MNIMGRELKESTPMPTLVLCYNLDIKYLLID